MSWRVAKALIELRKEIDDAFPSRSKISDGSIGDASHQARKSDHDPNAAGVITAIDVTNDPATLSGQMLADALVRSRDPRIKYLIWNKRIMSSITAPWIWRPYHGPNTHRHHVHISVSADPKLYDDARAWDLHFPDAAETVPNETSQPSSATLQLGSRGSDVAHLQTVLKITVDGIFGAQTEKAVKAFQSANGLNPDGIVGGKTFAALGIK